MKLNSGTKGKNVVINKEGHKAYSLPYKQELARRVLSSLVEPNKYYEDKPIEVSVRAGVAQDSLFMANLAAYARKVFGLRTISHVIVAELAAHPEGKQYIKELLPIITWRADETTEILAYYLDTYGKPIPNSLKKGVAAALNKFDEYGLAKYNRKSKVKLSDAIKLCHPKPHDRKQSILFKKVIEGTLETPRTWETVLSKHGNNREVWEDLIRTRSLPALATLRNLRNILEADVGEEYVAEVAKTIERTAAIAGIFPHQYFIAYDVISGIRPLFSSQERKVEILKTAIANAFDTATSLYENSFKGRTVILVDDSGSMGVGVSGRSDVTCANIAAVLGSVAYTNAEDGIIGLFSSDFRIVPSQTIKGVSPFKITQFLNSRFQGRGTQPHLAFRYLLENKINVDRILVFSDMQVFDTSDFMYNSYTLQQHLERYKKQINPNVWLHSVDLSGYDGGSQFMVDKRVNLLSGFSDRIIQQMRLAEEGISRLVQEIEEYEWSK